MDNNKAKEITTINGGVTDEQVAAWKNKHGRISEVEVVDTDTNERHIAYFHRPNMATMQAFSAAAKNNEVKAAEILFDNCWLGGSPAIKADAIYKMEAMNAMQGVFGRCTRALKNL